ncbi:MAG: DNA repair protein RadA [Flavobacteriales bacterium]|nr:DNA repair protein RadA [Flavobacteriales bacterium]
MPTKRESANLKPKVLFFCTSCGQEFPKWMGRCPACQAWNTFKEAPSLPRDTKKVLLKESLHTSKPQSLNEENSEDQIQRLLTGLKDFNLVLGGGLVRGSVVLLAGEPGIGKSTLALQAMLHENVSRSLYISGEESGAQIRQRARRLGLPLESGYVLTDASLENISAALEELKPDLAVVDSVQTLFYPAIEAPPGSLVQIRECTARLIQWARHTGIPMVLIGHVNKEGDIAGPKILEHMVDVVLQFEGDRYHHYRMLRAPKNRYGNTQELGIFEMTAKGLREVRDPSGLFISGHAEGASGSALAVVSEGSRALLVEVQALVTQAVYGMPQRICAGFDSRRFNMLMAVVEKRCGFRLNQKDIYLNVTGGIRIEDPGADLAVIAAVVSSLLDVPLRPSLALAGEVGLTGEVRPVHRLEQRLSEIQRLGISTLALSDAHSREALPTDLKTVFLPSVRDILPRLFEKAYHPTADPKTL